MAGAVAAVGVGGQDDAGGGQAEMGDEQQGHFRAQPGDVRGGPAQQRERWEERDVGGLTGLVGVAVLEDRHVPAAVPIGEGVEQVTAWSRGVRGRLEVVMTDQDTEDGDQAGQVVVE